VADLVQVGFLNVTPDMPVWAIWTVVAALSLLRLRRMAAAGAWLGTAAFVIAAAQDSVPFFWYSMLLWSGWILLGVVVAAALTWSPGPALGWELVGGRRVAVLVAAVGISVVLVMKSLGTFNVLYVPIRDSTLVFGDRFTLWVLAVVVLTAGGLVAAGMGTREGRRVALVLCVPVVVSVLLLVVPGGADETLVAALSYGVPVVLLVALGGIPWRGHTRTRA
jgi:hypothetical protein